MFTSGDARRRSSPSDGAATTRADGLLDFAHAGQASRRGDVSLGSRKPKTHTNAPRHWPAIELTQFDNAILSTLQVGATLAPLSKQPGGKIAFLRDFLYEDGILRVPIMLEEGGRRTGVFVYSDRDASAAAHYSGVRALLRAREGVTAVYYGASALMPTKPGQVLQPIDTPFFSKPKASEEEGSYALWWTSEETPKLGDSPERELLDRWFESLDGYGFLLFTAFLKDLELIEDKGGVFALPQQPFLQPLDGPADTRMLLHASAREGVFLAFDESTPVSRRQILLRLLADFAQGYRSAIEARGIDSHPDENGFGLERWRSIRDAALSKETNGAGALRLHGIELRDGQSRRDPNATTSAERAAQPQPPGREELDFAMDLVDRIVAGLKGQRAAGSSQTEVGAPNFAPVIAARVAGDLIERRIPYEDAEVTQAAAARSLDEWPEAEIVAVIADGAIREDGRRSDIFDVKVENRVAGRAGALFQRYRVADDGAIELIGNPTAMPSQPFLVDSTASREPAPDDSLTALARRMVESIVKTLTIMEPSGMCGDDPEEPLFSPSALVGKPGEKKPTLMRFMMQGPITAAMSCVGMMHKEPGDWVAYHIDDLVSRNGAPDRRLRLCVQRRDDPGVAVFDQGFEQPQAGKPFTTRGGLEFRRWGGSMFPADGGS